MGAPPKSGRAAAAKAVEPEGVSSKASIPSAAFTPGPWRVVRKGHLMFNIETVADYDARTFVAFTGSGPDIPSEANATLIASAPDLLEALKPFARMTVIDDRIGGLDPEQMRWAVAQARAAIARARGAAQ